MSSREIAGQLVYGLDLDAQGRCRHYHSELDVVAIQFYCCGRFFACTQCHQALASHQPQRWPGSRFEQQAVLCGSCGALLAIDAYLRGQAACPRCQASFNPGCANHYHLYFQVERG